MQPVSKLIPIRVLVAERFLYLPLVGAALAGAAFWQVLPRPRAKAAAVGAMIALLTALAVARLGAWTDESVFWRDAVRTAPDSFTAAEALGACYFREHRWAEAEAVFRQMVREHPEDAGAAYALATFYFNTQRFSEAQAVFERLVQLDPANPTYRAGVRQSRAASEESEGK
jgi:Flp pilus assembly protein TadD